jgi:hypothetical protein
LGCARRPEGLEDEGVNGWSRQRGSCLEGIGCADYSGESLQGDSERAGTRTGVSAPNESVQNLVKGFWGLILRMLLIAGWK